MPKPFDPEAPTATPESIGSWRVQFHVPDNTIANARMELLWEVKLSDGSTRQREYTIDAASDLTSTERQAIGAVLKVIKDRLDSTIPAV